MKMEHQYKTTEAVRQYQRERYQKEKEVIREKNKARYNKRRLALGLLPKVEINRTAQELYVAQRNELIPLAEAEANRRAGYPETGRSESDREEWASVWNYVFHSTMNKLWTKK
jgi:hypothetical protein